jgi:hypothetical protein
VIEITLASGATRREFIDTRTFQQLRTESTRHVRGRPVQIRTTFAGHKKVRGVVFPRQIEIEAAGRPQRLRIVLERVEVDPEISDARFEMPEIHPGS